MGSVPAIGWSLSVQLSCASMLYEVICRVCNVVILQCKPEVATEGQLPASCVFAWAAGGIGRQAARIPDVAETDMATHL